MKRPLSLFALTASVLVLMCGYAAAITVTFVEPPDSAASQTITPTISFGSNEPVVGVSITPGTETATLIFVVVGGVPPAPVLGPFVLIEPGVGPIVASDFITVDATTVDSAGTRFTMTFRSDTESGLTPPPNSVQFVETGLSQNVFTGSILALTLLPAACSQASSYRS